MELNYKKNKNGKLFTQLNDEKLVNIDELQNYIPIYSNFFSLNENNFNSINLNNNYKLNSISEKLGYSKFNGTIIDDSNNVINRKIFFKYGPLVDPIKYMLGKYEESIFQLPKLSNNENINKKTLDTNNSAYTDGFFSFLSSLLLNKYNFLNGIDYYGSFLGIKKNFLITIEDDLEYLNDSEFFHKNNNILFNIQENNNQKNYFSNTKKYKKPLVINDENINIDEIIIDDLIENKLNINNITSDNNLEIEYTKESNLNEKNINKKKVKTNEQNVTESSCSSRYSNTDSSEIEDSDEEEDSISNGSSYESAEDEEIYANIFKFPVQTIALECCEDTLDSYIINTKIKDDEWESIISQIIFTLITYQKVFEFTHNDLHTNNIVYNKTEKKYLYYKYDNKHYKIPTFGKIYKIIDFGRAIYKFKGNIICSDSYAPEGDAHTQYNTEPYFNKENLD